MYQNYPLALICNFICTHEKLYTIILLYFNVMFVAWKINKWNENEINSSTHLLT